MLLHHKKGMTLVTLVGLILLAVGAGLIIGLIVDIFEGVDDKTVENLCRTTNALRYETDIDLGVTTVSLSPRGCKTIDKEDIPSKNYKKNYEETEDAAKAEVQDLMARCWLMWLEGQKKNMFDNPLWTGDSCYICYTFSIDQNAGFSYKDLVDSMTSTAYEVTDDSDKCAGGGGGYCQSTCEDEFPQAIPSTRCEENNKCCISSIKNVCMNKGGICSASKPATASLYTRWSCEDKDKQCYVKKENFLSYTNYLQGTTQEGEETGAIMFDDPDGSIDSGKKYAISFLSPDETATWETWISFGVLGTFAVVGVVASGGILLPVALAAGGAGFAGLLTTEPGELNYIYVSDFELVSKKCNIESK